MYKPFKGTFFGAVYRIDTKEDALREAFYCLYRTVNVKECKVVGRTSGYPGCFVLTYEHIYFAEDKTPQQVVSDIRKEVFPEECFAQEREEVEKYLSLQMITILESKGIDWMAKEI